MKKFTLPTIFLFLFNFVVAHAVDKAEAAQTTKPDQAKLAASSTLGDHNRNIEAYGWIVGRQIVEDSMSQFAFSDIAKKVLVEALIKGAQGQGSSPINSPAEGDALENFLETSAIEKQKLDQEDKTKPEISSTLSDHDRKQIEAYGWILGKQTVEGSMLRYGFTEAERKVLREGFIKGTQGQGSALINSQAEGETVQNYLKTREDQETAKQISANKAESKAFFEKLDKEGKVKKTETGLYYEIIKEGSKEMPKSDSTIKIDYVGKFTNGTEFDSSKKRGQPATFSLEQVIPGFKEGLQLVGKGGSIRLYVPSDQAYGDHALPGIPAASTLVFDVDILDILPGKDQQSK